MIRGVHHVGIHVCDLQRMAHFYQEAFGFQPIADPFHWQNDTVFDRIVNLKNTAGKGCMLRSGNCYIELFEFSKPAPDIAEPKSPNDKGYTHFCIDVTDIEQEMQRLISLGMSFGEAEPVNAGYVKSIYGRDPEGNIIEIQETLDCGFGLEDLSVVSFVGR